MNITLAISFEDYNEPFTEKERKLVLEKTNLFAHIGQKIAEGESNGQFHTKIPQDDEVLFINAMWKLEEVEL